MSLPMACTLTERRPFGRRLSVKKWWSDLESSLIFTSLNVFVVNIHAPLREISRVEEGLPVDKGNRQAPYRMTPSVVRATVTACVEGGALPCATPTLAFQPTIVPSSVEKRNVAGAPGASRKSVVLP